MTGRACVGGGTCRVGASIEVSGVYVCWGAAEGGVELVRLGRVRGEVGRHLAEPQLRAAPASRFELRFGSARRMKNRLSRLCCAQHAHSCADEWGRRRRTRESGERRARRTAGQ